MSTDMKVWLGLIISAVSWLADEDGQRRAWFGIGPEIDSPAEAFMGFLDDAAVEEFLKCKNTGLHENQLESLRSLTLMVRKLCNETNEEEKAFPKGYELPPTFINDPRWQKVISAAKKTKGILGMRAV